MKTVSVDQVYADRRSDDLAKWYGPLPKLQWLKSQEHHYWLVEPVNPGGTVISLSKKQFLDKNFDAVQAFSDYYAVSRSDYLGWVNDMAGLRCSAMTPNKKQCKNYIKGKTPGACSPREWSERKGSYCTLHEESK